MVLVAMLGVGVAEQSGLINTLLKRTVTITPAKLITPVVVFLGVMSNIASDAGYVILIPLGAMIFRAYGRHPLAGLAAAFAGVSGGFSANLLIGTLDPLLAGISQAAASIIDPTYEVAVMGNYWFIFCICELASFLIYSLVLCIFKSPCMFDIMQYLSFCELMILLSLRSLRFIHIAACRDFLPFMIE